jgi:hypothetical protein
MKNIISIALIIILQGCIPVMDPPNSGGLITIHNYSDSAIYVYLTCKDSIQMTPKLGLFEVLHGSIDENGKKRDSVYSPNYRVNAYTYGDFEVSGTREHPKLYCDNKIIYAFIISEKNMRTKQWKEICTKQLYEKKYIFTEEQLDKIGWKFTYSPLK